MQARAVPWCDAAQENHHLAAAFTLMQDKQYSFLPASSKKVCGHGGQLQSKR